MMAADTPQMATEAASSARSLSSTPSQRATNQVKKNTVVMRITAWSRPFAPKATISARLMVAPSRTRPVLRKNSVRKYAARRSFMPKTDRTPLASRPSKTAYTGNSITRSCLLQVGTALFSFQVATVNRTTRSSDADHHAHCFDGSGRLAETTSPEVNTRSLIVPSPFPSIGVSRDVLQYPGEYQCHQGQPHHNRQPVLREQVCESP